MFISTGISGHLARLISRCLEPLMALALRSLPVVQSVLIRTHAMNYPYCTSQDTKQSAFFIDVATETRHNSLSDSDDT
jgi:hypothetical protein